jgi:Fe-S-cluster containining protein
MRSKIKKDTPLKDILEKGNAINCKKCGHCCKYSSGFLIETDITKIKDFLDIDEKELKEKYLENVDLFNTVMFRPKILRDGKPFGKCIFLNDDDKCKIHKVKPMQCKIGICDEKHGHEIMEWFYLNYCVKPFNRSSLLQWQARLKSHDTIEGGRIEELIPSKEIRNKILSEELKK